MKTFEQLGAETGRMVDETNREYGLAFGKTGAILQILYPEGASVGQLKDIGLIARVLDEIGRIANNTGAFGENPYTHITGYGLLGQRQWAQVEVDRSKKLIDELRERFLSPQVIPSMPLAAETQPDSETEAAPAAEPQPECQEPEACEETSGKAERPESGKGKNSTECNPEWLTVLCRAAIRTLVEEGKGIRQIAAVIGQPWQRLVGMRRRCPEFAELLEYPSVATESRETEPGTKPRVSLNGRKIGELEAQPSPVPDDLRYERVTYPETAEQVLVPDEKAEPTTAEESKADVQPVELKEPVVLPPAETAPLPQREPPGYLEWLNNPEKAAKISNWVSKRMQPGEIARKMGITPAVLFQWKTMSVEFAALFRVPARRSLADGAHGRGE